MSPGRDPSQRCSPVSSPWGILFIANCDTHPAPRSAVQTYPRAKKPIPPESQDGPSAAPPALLRHPSDRVRSRGSAGTKPREG